MHEILALVFGVLSVLGTLLLREFHDIMPYLAGKIVEIVSRYMLYDGKESLKIWQGDLDKIPGKLLKLVWALKLIKAPFNQIRQELEVSPYMVFINVSARSIRFKAVTRIFTLDGVSESDSIGYQKIIDIESVGRSYRERNIKLKALSEDESAAFVDMQMKVIRFKVTRFLFSRMLSFTRNSKAGIDFEVEEATHRLISPKLRKLQCMVHEKNYSNPIYKALTGCVCIQHICKHDHQEV